jgi:hypothetical protein
MELSVEELKDLINAIKESVKKTEDRIMDIDFRIESRIDNSPYHFRLLDRNKKYLERLELIEQRLKAEQERLVRK